MKLFRLQDHFGYLITHYTDVKGLEPTLKNYIEKDSIDGVNVKEYMGVDMIDCDLSLSEDDLLDLIFSNYSLYNIDELDLERNFKGLQSMKLLNVIYKYNPRFTIKADPDKKHTEYLILFEYNIE